MRTQEELRDWIRSGMPLPEDKYQAPEPATLCQVFELRVYPEHARLTVRCAGCGHDEHFRGLRLHPDHATQGVRTPIQAARDWISCHWTADPTMRVEERFKAGFRLKKVDQRQVEAWAVRELAWIVPNSFTGIVAGIPKGPHLELIQGAGISEG